MPRIRQKIILGLVSLVLFVVWIAGRLNPTEVQWTGFDYLVAGLLLAGLGLSIEWTLRRCRQHKTRWWIIALILVIFALLWLELAVGIFGSPFAGT